MQSQQMVKHHRKLRSKLMEKLSMATQLEIELEVNLSLMLPLRRIASSMKLVDLPVLINLILEMEVVSTLLSVL